MMALRELLVHANPQKTYTYTVMLEDKLNFKYLAMKRNTYKAPEMVQARVDIFQWRNSPYSYSTRWFCFINLLSEFKSRFFRAATAQASKRRTCIGTLWQRTKSQCALKWNVQEPTSCNNKSRMKLWCEGQVSSTITSWKVKQIFIKRKFGHPPIYKYGDDEDMQDPGTKPQGHWRLSL